MTFSKLSRFFRFTASSNILLIFSFNRIDDILTDSDSDLESEDEKTKENKPAKNAVYIQEAPDSIVDLADLNEFSKVTSEFLEDS